jgi:type IV pilus assembly protein PilP
MTRGSSIRLGARAASSLLIVSALLAGCSPSTQDLHDYIAQTKARQSVGIPPLPEMQTFETFAFPTSIPRDPFAEQVPASRVAQRRNDGPRPDLNRPREALEEFALDSLRMMGTLQQKHQLWALVKDPTGTIHRVETGNFLGRNYGEVVAISERAVELMELTPSGEGSWEQRRAALAIKE